MMQAGDRHSDNPADSRPAQADRLNYTQLVNVLLQYKWLVIGATLLGTAAAAYVGKQMTPAFTASTSIVIEPHRNQVVEMTSVVSEMTPDEFTVATQLSLLSSRRHIELVMTSLDLFNDPDFVPHAESDERAGSPLSLGNLVDQARAWLPEVSAREDEADVASDPPRDLVKETAIERFEDHLAVRQEGKSYILSVAFTSPDPVRAAMIANETAALFVEQARADKLDATNQATGWLAGRVSALRDEVTKAEQAVETFRAQNKLFDTREGSADLDSSELLALNTKLVDLRTEVLNLKATLALIRQKRVAGENLDDVPEIGNAPTIVRLRQEQAGLIRREAELATTYGPRYPTMVIVVNEKEKIATKIEQETARLIVAMNDEMQLLQNQQRTIEEQIGGLRFKDTEQSQLAIQLRELEREAGASRQLYDSFLQRFKETREQQALVQPDVRQVSQAAPPTTPSSPGPKVFAAVGFTVSFMASSLIALIAGRLDKTLHDARQIKQNLGLETSCSVPTLRLGRSIPPHRYLIEKPLSAYAEAIRSAYLMIRDGLEMKAMPAGSTGKVVLVTSSLPGEGKSTFALSLATLLAQQQHKTLIIDLDVRHPSIHKNFHFASSAGIIDYCADQTIAWQDIIAKDSRSDLDVVVAQARGRHKCPNPVALMESARLQEAFRILRLEYDIIVIDSPPLLGVIEARMATAFADAALFVVGWGKVDVETAQAALSYLQRSQLPIIGAVLSQVDMTKQGKYYDDQLAKHYQKFEKYYIN